MIGEVVNGRKVLKELSGMDKLNWGEYKLSSGPLKMLRWI
jgi:hypothetical protein